jgi:geranylgeranyl diphosphate synthase type II
MSEKADTLACPTWETHMLTRIEQALAHSFAHLEGPHTPPRLLAAMRHAVFPGGARIRPQRCLAVAGAAAGVRARL